MPVLEMGRPVVHDRSRDITDDCPLCAVYGREPNAEMLEAIREADVRGSLPPRFATRKDMWSALMAEVDTLED